MDPAALTESAKVPSDLWERLLEWRSGPDGQSFVARLDSAFTLEDGNAARLADEYIRFLALAATGPVAPVPSRIIDEVWRWHSLDPSVWRDRFCPQVLGRALQYEAGPTPHWRDPGYDKTRERYRAAFGKRPPKDIWPDAWGHLRLRLFPWFVLLVCVAGTVTMVLWVPLSAIWLVPGCLFSLGIAISAYQASVPVHRGERRADTSGGWWG